MVSLSLYVGIVGNVISVLLFLSPVRTFERIVKNGSTEEFDSLPYICTLLNSALWTYYGCIATGKFLVATVNGFGVAVEIVYITLFLIFADPRLRVKTGVLVGIIDVGFLGGVVLVSELVLQGEMRIDVVGFLGAVLNIVMYASPLAAMKTVVTTKSVEYMPFLLSLFVLFNGGIWTFYAVLESDIYLGIPNGAGFILGVAQLILYAIYFKSGKSGDSPVEEDGSLKKPLILSSTTNMADP